MRKQRVRLQKTYTISGVLGYVFYGYKTLVCLTWWQLDLLLKQDLFAIAFVLDPCCAARHIRCYVQARRERMRVKSIDVQSQVIFLYDVCIKVYGGEAGSD